jgi:hypothetical protein
MATLSIPPHGKYRQATKTNTPQLKTNVHQFNKPKAQNKLTVQPRPNRLPRLTNQHARIIVEPHHAPVRPLPLLLRAHDHGMPYVAAPDFVRSGDGDAAAPAWAGFGAEVALLLDYDYDAVA